MDALIQNEYIRFLLILLASIALAKVIHLSFTRYMKKAAEKTKSKIDDILLKITTKPIYLIIIFVGLFFSFKSLSILEPCFIIIDQIFFVGIVLLLAVLISRISTFILSLWLKTHDKYEKTPKLLRKIISIAVYLIAIIIILGYFNVQVTPLIATLGIGGLAIGLAFQNTLTNFFAGLHIISDKPINVDDYIEIPEEKIAGYVQDIGWRSTRIKTYSNNIVIVPNSKLAETTIINDFMPVKEISILIPGKVSYNSDLDKVEKITLDVANKIQKTIKGAIRDYEPSMKFYAFGNSNIKFNVLLRAEKIADKYLIKHEFIKMLLKRFKEENIEISYPSRNIYQK